MKLSTAFLAALTALTMALPALAQTFSDDRLTLKFSAFHADSRISLATSGDIRSNIGSENLARSASWRGRDKIQDASTQAHFQARLRLSDRQRVLGGHYRVEQSRGYRFSRTITASEFPNDPIDVVGDAAFQIDFELAHLMYEFAVVDTPRWLVGISAGIHWARLKATGNASAVASVEDERRTEATDLDWLRRRHAPSVGVRVAHAPSDRWLLGAEAQAFSLDWGNLAREDGHYERMGLGVDYRVTPTFGVHAGYDWFRLLIRDDLRGSLVSGEVTYEGRARGELRVHGPTLGFSVSF